MSYIRDCNVFGVDGKVVITAENCSEAMASPYKYSDFWVSVDNGQVNVGRGSVVGINVKMSWKDPNPIQTIFHVGISCWISPVEFRNFVFGTELVDEEFQT